jgi:ATP-dependent DNA helicase RecQ
VIQWRATCDLCTLWQRFGRAARDFEIEAIALFLVEPMYFDETKEEKAARKLARDLKTQEKGKERKRGTTTNLGKRKRSNGVGQNLSSSGITAPIIPTDNLNSPALPSVASDLRARFMTTTFTPSLTASSTQDMPLNSGLLATIELLHSDAEEDEPSEDDEPITTANGTLASAYEKDRQAVYAGFGNSVGEKKTRKRKKKDGTELEPAMDDMINAGSESAGRTFKCFRAPPTLLFGNADFGEQFLSLVASIPQSHCRSVSNHQECRPDLANGCPRCVVKKSTICCELCTPAAFQGFGQVTLDKKKPLPARSRVKEHNASASELRLRDALHQYRRDETTRMWGIAILKDMGPGIFMADDILHRIVECAHEHKIDSTASLSKETRWINATTHGTAIVALITLHCPKPVPKPLLASTPLQSRQAPMTPFPLRNPPVSASPSVRMVKARNCSKCGSKEHIASNRNCPRHCNYQSARENDENAFRVAPLHQSILRF